MLCHCTFVCVSGDEDFERIQDFRLVFDRERVEYNLTIATYDNVISTGSKNFAVQLSVRSGSRVRLAPSTITIEILDDDSLPSKWNLVYGFDFYLKFVFL